MKIKMENGAILESDNEMVNKMRLENGGVEVGAKVKGSSRSSGGRRGKKTTSKDANKDKQDADKNKEGADKDKE